MLDEWIISFNFCDVALWGPVSVYSSLYSQISRGHLWMMKWLLIMSSSCRCLFPGLYIDMLLHVNIYKFSSLQFSCSVMSNSLRPHELQHTRPPCPSPTPGVHSDSLTSIESVMPSSHLILFRPLLFLPPIPPSIRVFSNESTLHMRWPKDWSFSFRIFLPKKSQGWSPSEWTGWISLQSKGLSRVFSNTKVSKL